MTRRLKFVLCAISSLIGTGLALWFSTGPAKVSALILIIFSCANVLPVVYCLVDVSSSKKSVEPRSNGWVPLLLLLGNIFVPIYCLKFGFRTPDRDPNLLLNSGAPLDKDGLPPPSLSADAKQAFGTDVVIRIWWAWLWRTLALTTCSLVMIFFAMIVLKKHVQLLSHVLLSVPFIFLAVSLWTLKVALQQQYSAFFVSIERIGATEKRTAR